MRAHEVMFGEFTVTIREDIRAGSFKVFLYKQENRELYFITKSGDVHLIQEGAIINDDEVMFAQMTADQLKAFAEATAALGIKTNHDSIAEGKLAATERHLEDMRLIALSKYGGKS